jgi:hypothetical protein
MFDNPSQIYNFVYDGLYNKITPSTTNLDYKRTSIVYPLNNNYPTFTSDFTSPYLCDYYSNRISSSSPCHCKIIFIIRFKPSLCKSGIFFR